MNRMVLGVIISAAVGFALAGCNTAESRMRSRPELVASLDPQIRAKIERGIVEPGYTPAMVFLALGKPTSPLRIDLDQTGDARWVYREFNNNDRDVVRGGFRQRIVFDPVRKSDVIITEAVDARLYPELQAHSLDVIFQNGRVVEVVRRAI
jgi:hypothetical protein